MNKKTIFNILKKYKSSSEIKGNIRDIGFFGSYAKGIRNVKSDIDIFVVLESARMFDVVRIKNELKKSFHKNVDVVVLTKSTNPYLKQQIKNHGVLV